jgi:hypothetical protein
MTDAADSPPPPSAGRFWVRLRFGCLGMIATVLLLAAAAGLGIYWQTSQPPEIVEHVDHASWSRGPALPPEARDVCYFRSYMYAAAEFNISEADFLAWARPQWPVTAVNGETVTIGTYRSALPRGYGAPRPEPTYGESFQKISRGYYFGRRHGNGGGVSVGYNAETGRAYYQSNPR